MGRSQRAIRSLMAESKSIVQGALRHIPGAIGLRLRADYYVAHLGKCGTSPRIMEGVFIDFPEMISFGDCVCINRYSILNGRRGISIGSNVLIGPFVTLQTVAHKFSQQTIPISGQGSEGTPIVVEDGVWIGAGAIVLDGVTLGRGCIVGAGSVVTGDIPPSMIYAGVPARQIGAR